MGMKGIKKVGSVTVSEQAKDGKLYLAFWSPTAGRMVYKSTGGTSKTEAVKQAKLLNAQLQAGAKALQHVDDRMMVREAMEAAIENSRSRTEKHLKNQRYYAAQFRKFLSGKYPKLRHWHEIKPAMVREYIEDMHRRDFSAKAMKHYAGVISLTSRWLSRQNPDLYRPLDTSHRLLSEAPKPEKNYLTAAQVAQAIAKAEELGEVYAGLALHLGAYAGMNLLEIARLRVDAFDLKRGLVSIGESKNRYRLRTIPLLPQVVEHVRRYLETRTVESPFLVVRTDGSVGTDASLAKPVRRVIRACEKLEGGPVAGQVVPKDLRKTFINLAVVAGVRNEWLTAYIGHTPKSILEAHYGDFGSSDLLRREVLAPVSAHLAEVEAGAGAQVLDMMSAQ